MSNSILLVDDERWVRTALKITIEKLDMPFTIIHECNNGLEALDWLRQNKVDLVLTDVRMPIMDGLALTRQIKEESFVPDVIIISVHDDFHFLQESLRNGVFDYLLKPVEVDDLRTCLEKWLERHNKNAIGSLDNSDSVAEANSPISQVLQYIKDTPLGNVTLAEAAKKVHMNPSYLSQLFKQHMNKNFVDYLMEVRINEAKRLLTSTSLRISDISERLGYADLPYFSNVFKRLTGSTPSEYRNQKSKIIKSS